MYLAILWHQHQPLYRDPNAESPRGSLRRPWVRLHALRDYYAMAALVAEHPEIHLTINLTPVLLEQLDDYLYGDRTDRALELTRTPVPGPDAPEAEEILGSFFEADWHNQIFPHSRYKELFLQRQERRTFDEQDFRDLRMWFNLAWFDVSFRSGPVDLVTGERVDVHRFVEKGSAFGEDEIREMVGCQYRVMRAVVAMHRRLQDDGRLEISTTPYFHPILPLVMDTGRATLDRPGTGLPERFAYPDDAQEHVRRALDDYEGRFGRRPEGMWPAEGGVSPEAVRLLGEAGIRWVASDRGVLARSGRWGYEADDPNVLHRPYRHVVEGLETAIFFRDSILSDRIGFDYQSREDPEEAARAFVAEVKERGAGDPERIVTVILDGENAWGGYREDGKPFLRALYRHLANDEEIRTVTPADYLAGDPERGIDAHPVESLERIYELFTGSWIDEAGSQPGVDLGTWIGEEEENRAWELLLEARRTLDEVDGSPPSESLGAILAAEGSDWFWWFGSDQQSGDDAEFDELFRAHLRGMYGGLDLEPPAELDEYIVRQVVVWTFASPVERIRPEDTLVIRTNCPGVLEWQVDQGRVQSMELTPSGGVMAGSRRFSAAIGPFGPSAEDVGFRFLCRHPGCSGDDRCCSPDQKRVRIE